MKKNRGFTLIELLAVIVITGILSIMVVPKISNIVTESKMKLYIQDAKKMVTQAQYRMSANNADIEKPEIGECIIFSLNYLAVNDFRNPPNNGKYMDESSFVVVKNENGTLEYAVMLVEHRKDGLYQGVEFITEKQLMRNDSLKHVRYFDSSDIRYIDRTYSTESEGEDLQGTSDKVFIDTDFINQQLRKSGLDEDKWLKDDSVTKTYNKIKADKTVVADAAIPTFSAKITTNNTSGLGILQATLTINAEDADDALNSLTVCTRVTKNEDGIYPTRSDRELCESYGNNRYYTKSIDFEKYGLDYETNSIGYVYIAVFDPSGHSARKLREYVVHKNDGPVIHSLTLSKRDQDKENLGKAKLEIHVDDDINDKDELEVCIEMDMVSQSGICSNTYRKYYSVFNYEDTAEVDFESRPDGSTHSITVYVRDKARKVSYTSASYTLYRNTVPTFETVVFKPIAYEYDPTKNSLDYTISMTIVDDISTDDNIYVKIGDNSPMAYTEYKRKYLASPSNAVKFTAPGIYDGLNRNIVIKVWDEYESEASANYSIFTLDNVYREAPPAVSQFKILDDEKICMDSSHCLNNKESENELGAYKVKFSVCISNDCSNLSDTKKDAKICISENKNDCMENTSNLRNHYMTFEELDNFTYTFSVPEGYDKYTKKNDVRTIYYNVIEHDNISNPLSTYNTNPESFSKKYTIYANKAPELTSKDVFTMTSSSNTHQSPLVRIKFNDFKVKDDFNDYKVQICYREINSESDVFEEYACTNEDRIENVSKKYSNETFQLRDLNGIPYSGVNHGELIDAYVRFIDHKGEKIESNHIRYSLADESAPYISAAKIESQQAYFNSNFFNLTFYLVDPGDTYTYCLKEKTGSDFRICNPEDYHGDENGNPYNATEVTETIPLNGHKLFGWSTDYSEENPVKNFVFSVKDSKGNVDYYNLRHDDLTYELYVACQDELNCDEKETKFELLSDPVTPEACNGICIKYDESTGNGQDFYATKKRTFKGTDKFSKTNCVFPSEVKEYCNSKDCFVPTTEGTTYKYLGIQVADKNVVTSWDATGEEEKVYDEEDPTNIACNKLYEDNQSDIDSALFTEKDKRCSESYSNYCNSVFAPNACKHFLYDGGENSGNNYYACLEEQEANCRLTLQDFCKNSAKKTYIRVDCNEAHNEKFYCDLNTLEAQMLGGQCIHSSPNCTPTPEATGDESGSGDTGGNGSNTSTDSTDVIPDQVNGSVGSSSSINLDNSCTLYEIKHDLCNSNDFYCSDEAYEQGLCEKSEVISTQTDDGDAQLEYDCPDEYKDNKGNCLPLCSEAYVPSDWGKKCIPRIYAIFPEESTCKTVCFKVMDCTPRKKTVIPHYDCHGHYTEYVKADTVDGIVLLKENTSKFWCPEFLDDSRYRDKYVGFDKGYIIFDENQVTNLKDLKIEKKGKDGN